MAWNLTRTWLVRHPESTIEQIAAGTEQTSAAVGSDITAHPALIDYRGMHPRYYALKGYRWPEHAREPHPDFAGLGRCQRAIILVLRERPSGAHDLSRALRTRVGLIRAALQTMLARGIVVETIEASGRVVWSLNKAAPSAAGGEHVG